MAHSSCNNLVIMMSMANPLICFTVISSNFALNICQPYFSDTSSFMLMTPKPDLYFSYFYTFFGHFGASSSHALFIWSWSYFRLKCCFERIFQEFALNSSAFGKFHGRIMTSWYSANYLYSQCCLGCFEC